MSENRTGLHYRCTISLVISIIIPNQNTVGFVIATDPLIHVTCPVDDDDGEDAFIMRLQIKSKNPELQERPRSVSYILFTVYFDTRHADGVVRILRDIHGKPGSQTYGISYMADHIDSRKPPCLFFGGIRSHDHSFTTASLLYLYRIPVAAMDQHPMYITTCE